MIIQDTVIMTLGKVIDSAELQMSVQDGAELFFSISDYLQMQYKFSTEYNLTHLQVNDFTYDQLSSKRYAELQTHAKITIFDEVVI